MGIFLDRIRRLNELQIEGQDIDDSDDFTLDDDDDETVGTEAPADVAQQDAEQTNAQDNADVNENDDTEADDDPTTDEEDDFTLDDTDVEDTNATEGNADADGETTDTPDDGGNDNANDAEQNNDAGENKIENPTEEIADADAKAAEEQIYDSLTDDQKRIRVLQLKIDYKDLYETITNTIDAVNRIPKNMENIDTIKRLTEYLTKCKNILIDYVENVFDQNPYLENYATYLKYMAIFRTVARVMEEMNKAKEKK